MAFLTYPHHITNRFPAIRFFLGFQKKKTTLRSHA